MRTVLRRLREHCGYTQQAAADGIGISRAHYNAIETGERDGQYKTWLKIKDFFNYHDDDIFFNDDCCGTQHQKNDKGKHSR